ncbi:MAG: hypothetical protein LQ351_001307 [Letrouitia transgressa]|nr:MAG: hypothetical protein LQ351_001307 [Letrouitia transgressa]
MADSLYELLVPHLESSHLTKPLPSFDDPVTAKYLDRVYTLPLSSLTTTEPQAITQASHSTLLSIQSLSLRSSAEIVASSDHLSNVREILPFLANEAQKLRDEIPTLDKRTATFSSQYSRHQENEALDKRKRALLMERNADRLSDILDLPKLLSSSISSSAAHGSSGTGSYTSTLDLYSHIKRLYLLYQDSPLINTIYRQTENAMQDLISNLISSLRAPNIKLAAGMRTIGWLRRVVPDLENDFTSTTNQEGLLGYLFLVCRLSTLVSTLSALEPLRLLADQETENRLRNDPHTLKRSKPNSSASDWQGGQQTERYLKRFIEIFREQSFAIISTYRSVFPAAPDAASGEDLNPKFKTLGLKTNHLTPKEPSAEDLLTMTPSALSSFPLHLVSMLSNTLRQYLPNVRDRSSRESLFTQILYCAGSLGRLGGDFSLLVASFSAYGNDGEEGTEDEDEDEEGEWMEIMKKHRELAGRLEALASSGGAGKSLEKGGLATRKK